MDDAIAALLVMPVSAQIGLAFFVLTFVVMLFGPGIARRRYAAKLAPGRVPSLFGRPTLSTGDAKFDERFVVIQDGVPVRDGWLDATTRAAIITFFDAPAATGPVWVQDRQLQHIAGDEWVKLDLAALTGLLRQQAMLATALERTAGWRG